MASWSTGYAEAWPAKELSRDRSEETRLIVYVKIARVVPRYSDTEERPARFDQMQPGTWTGASVPPCVL